MRASFLVISHQANVRAFGVFWRSLGCQMSFDPVRLHLALKARLTKICPDASRSQSRGQIRSSFADGRLQHVFFRWLAVSCDTNELDAFITANELLNRQPLGEEAHYVISWQENGKWAEDSVRRSVIFWR